MQKRMFKSEKGSITLFVLLAILFFLIVIFSVFMTSSNKNRIQLSELDKIKQEYEKDVENIDEIYEDITRDSIFIVFRTPDGKLHPESRWTNQDLTVKIYYPEGTAEENKLVKIDNGEYTNYTGEFTINKSTKITAMIRNGKEKEANAKIDKTPPTYTTNPSVPNFPIPANSSVADISISVNASDAESGLKKLEYAYVEDTSTPTSYTELSNDEVLTFKSKPQGVYYLWLRIEDNVGNITNERVEMNVVDYVAKIGDTYYVTLQEAIDACPEGTLTQIDIIKPIEFKPNAVVPNGKNVTINLNGYSITGPGTIIENNGTLTIIDTNTANTGKITSTDGTVIQNNGTFTLGANDGIVNQTSPVLTGENMVINTSGTFNFYDGVLIGDKAIEGTINSQPDEYSVISKKEGDKERVYLGVLAESAARIDKWFYNTLDEAIADCPENAGEEKTTITILRDLSLTTKATIDNGKNVIIDLNGHSITNTISDYVIENSSTLEILDSTDSKSGVVKGDNYSTILNNRNANLTISSGTISLSKNDFSVIRNEGNLLLQDNGILKTTTEEWTGGDTYGIYNIGNVEIKGGNIAATKTAIYNANEYYISEECEEFKKFGVEDFVKNGSYYFQADELGRFVSNNQGKNSTTANSYIELDLTDKVGTYLIQINAEISSESGNDIGYAAITESTRAPSYSNSSNRFMYISGTVKAKNYTKELAGGKKYYLHFGYRKNSSTNMGEDSFKINSVGIAIPKQTPGTLNINGGIIKGYSGIINNSIGEVNINDGQIICRYGHVIDNNSGIINIRKINLESMLVSIYNNAGTINIGSNDSIIDTNIVEIRSISGTALENENGIINFYDGTIEGEDIINGEITSVPENCELEITTTSSGKKNAIIIPSKGPVAQIENTTYNSLKEAFDSITTSNEEQTTITLLRDIILLNENSIPTIDSSKNVFLDLNGHTISNESQKNIENSGNLEIGSNVKASAIQTENMVNNNTYFFVSNEEGKLVPNNLGKESTVANSYIKIDLTNMTGNYQIKINAEMKSNYNIAFASISTYATRPYYYDVSGRFMFITGDNEATNYYSYELEGGNVYYLNLGYYRTSGIDNNEDMKINSIEILSSGKIESSKNNSIVNNGNLILSEGCTIYSISKEYSGKTYALYNNPTGKITINGGTISSKTTEYNSYSYGIYNLSKDTITMNSGIITVSGEETYGLFNANEGKILINGGNITTLSSDLKAYGIYNKSTGIIDISNASINSYNSSSYDDTAAYGIYNIDGIVNLSDACNVSAQSSNEAYGIYNCNSNEINIFNANIYSFNRPGYSSNIYYGIYNKENGIIHFLNGHISASNYGIYNNQSGTIILGENDSDVSQTLPEILLTSARSPSYGIYNPSGEFDFYDGKITAGISISGIINNVATNCDVIKTPDNDFETATLDNSPVAQINNEKYSTLQQAFDAVENNKEEQTIITLLRNTTILSEENRPIVPKDKNIYLNLNSFTISGGNASGLENNGKLEIGDKFERKSISLSEVVKNGDYYFEDDGTGKLVPNNLNKTYSTANSYIKLDLSNLVGTYELILNAEISSKQSYNYGYAIISESTEVPSSGEKFMNISGNVQSKDYSTELTGGKIYYLHLAFSKRQSIENEMFKINSIELDGSGKILSTNGNGITNNGTLSISDGAELYSEKHFAIDNKNQLTINDGNIIISQEAFYGINNNENATISMSGGKVQAQEKTNSSDLYGIFNLGTVNVSGGILQGIYNDKSGVVNISDDAHIQSYYGIFNNENGLVTMTEGEILSTYGMYNNNTGKIDITGGKIEASSYGVYNKDTGSIVIGRDDGNVSQSVPEILTTSTTESYGIFNNSGIFDFFDGKISGSISINGSVNSIPAGYDIIRTKSEDIETAILDNSPVAQIDETSYNTLQEAFDAVPDNKQEATIVKLLRNTTILNEENTPVVANSKNIYLDMNNYNIIAGNESGIINEGKLEIGNKVNSLCEDIDSTDFIANGEYYFEKDDTGAMVSNNVGVLSTLATSYIKLDLSNIHGDTILSVNAEISANNYGYATISENATTPSYDSSTGQFIKIYGNVSAKDYTTKLEGGKIYYLHFGYNKSTSTSSSNYTDIFKINSVNIETSGELLASQKGITNAGELTISDGARINASSTKDAYGIYNSGKLKVTGGLIQASSKIENINVYGIYNNSLEELNFENGRILVESEYHGKTYGIYNINIGKINMLGGNINLVISSESGSSYGIYSKEGEVNLIQGNIYYSATYRLGGASAYGIYTDIARVNIEEFGKIDLDCKGNSYGVYTSTGDIYMNGGNISSYSDRYSSYGIYVNDTANLYINKGIIQTSKDSNSSAYGIYNKSTGTINITDGIINCLTLGSSGSNYAYGIYNASGIINMISGKISVESVEDVDVSGAYGIYNNSKGKTFVGVNDNIVDISKIEILATASGNSYAIYNSSGIFNFYDGKISAGTATIYGNVTEVAPGYEIKKTTADGISTDILALSATDNTVCVLNSINYSSLQDALDACTGTENYTISLTNACRLAEPITIPKGKNITLSINGFDIYYDGSDSMIINNGTLTIKDTNTVSSGNLSNTIGSVIENNGTLIIGDNDGNVTSRSPHITGTDTAITNNGTIEFYDGTITGITPISGNEIKTIPEDYNLVETTEDNVKTLSLVGIAPEVTYTTESVSDGTKITVTATDTNLSMIINPDDSEITGTDTEIVSEYIVTSSGVYTFKAIDKNNNVTTIDVAV